MKLLAAVAQIQIQFEQISNYKSILAELCKEARQSEASLLMLPELWIHGYHKQTILDGTAYHLNAVTPFISQMAKEYNLAITGSYVEDNSGSRFNTHVLFGSSGEILAKYRKTHLFRPLHEDRYFDHGNEVVVVDTDFGRIGLATCYDLRFPELFRAMTARGAEGFLLCAEWPSSRTMHWQTLSRARAIENQAWMLCGNCTGITGRHEFGGHSSLISPDGTLQSANIEPGLHLFQLDTESSKQYRSDFPVLDDIRIDLV